MIRPRFIVLAVSVFVFGVCQVSAAEEKPAKETKIAVDRAGDSLPAEALMRIGSERFRHRTTIRSIAFSPDGKLLATGGADHMIHLHDLKTGQLKAVAKGCTWEVMRLDFSPDGKSFMSIDGGTFRLWEAATAQERLAINTPWDRLTSHAWSPSGKLVALSLNEQGFPKGRNEGNIRIHSLTTGQPVSTWTAPNLFVHSMAFTPDGKSLLIGVSDGTVRYLDPRTGKESRPPAKDVPRVNSLFIMPDGKTALMSDTIQGGLIHWDLQADKVVKQTAIPANFGSSPRAYSRDGRLVASYKSALGGKRDQPGELYIIETATGKAQHAFEVKESILYGMTFSPDNKTLAAFGWNQNPPSFWDLDKGKPVEAVPGHGKRVNALAFSTDSSLLFTGSDDHTLGVWDRRTGELKTRIDAGYQYVSMALSADNKYLGTVGFSSKIGLWDAATGKQVLLWEYPKAILNHVVFSPDSKTMATAGNDRVISLWEVPSGKLIDTLKGHTFFVRSLAFSPDGKHLVSAADDKTVRVWEAVGGKPVNTFKSHAVNPTIVRYAPDGKRIASADTQRIFIWEPETGKILQTLQGPFPKVLGLAWSHDSKYLAISNGGESTHGSYIGFPGPDSRFDVVLLDVATGKAVHRFVGHRNFVGELAFSRDGKFLASGSNDTTALIWKMPDDDILQKAAKPLPNPIDDRKKQGAVKPENDRTGFEFCSTQEPMPATKKVRVPEPIHIFRPTKGVLHSAAISPDGRLVATGSTEGAIHLWDTESGVVKKTLEGQEGSITDLFFTPDGKSLYSASMFSGSKGDLTVRVWNVQTGEERRRYNDLGGDVHSISLSPDGRSLACAVRNHVAVLNVADGKERWKIEDKKRVLSPTWVRFSPKGDLVAISRAQIGIQLVDSESGKPVHSFPERVGHNNAFRPVFGPNNSWLIMSLPGRPGLEVRDIARDQTLLRCFSPVTTESILTAAISPDGRLLVGAYTDPVIWDTATGRVIRTLPGNKIYVQAIHFSRDGSRMVTWNYGGASLWELDDPAVWHSQPVRGNLPTPIDDLWLHLEGADAAAAFRAIDLLSQKPAVALPFLRERLKPVATDFQDVIREAIGNLASEDFTIREQAQQVLQKHLKNAEPVLRHLMTKSTSSEVRGRAAALLAQAEQKFPAQTPRQPGELFGETLRTTRAIHVLEKIGTREAQGILTKLADGFPSAPETLHAKAALDRLEKWKR